MLRIRFQGVNKSFYLVLQANSPCTDINARQARQGKYLTWQLLLLVPLVARVAEGQPGPPLSLLTLAVAVN